MEKSTATFPIRPWLALVFLAFLLAEAQGANIMVNTAVDELNGNTSSVANLIATPGGAGISLREAIIATNNTAGADVISFAAALNGVPITLSRVGDDNDSNNGDLDINGNLTITGNGAGNTIIQGSTSATFTGGMGDKAIGINQDGTFLGLTVSISDLTIRFCRNANTSGFFTHTGGAVDVFLTGVGNNITFSNCTITGNENVNGWGGGVNVDSGTVGAPGDVATNTTNRGTVTFTNCAITDNKVVSSSEGAGLNLYSDIHNVVLNGCTVTGNTGMGATSNGGGVNIRHSFGGTVTISGGTYSGNTTAGIGGGICIEGNQHISMSNVTVNGNSSTNSVARAGGVSITCLGLAGFTANINLNTVTISNNHADNGASEGGGLYFNSPYGATLTNCSITGNTAKTGAGIQNAGGTTAPIILAISGGSITNNVAAMAGGGLSHDGSPTTTTVTNCSITGNTANGNGGGVRVINGIVTLDGVTLSNNTADNDNNSTGDGGGIFRNGGTLNLNNTIAVGANSAVNGGGIANISGNLSKTSGLLTVANNNAKNHGGGLFLTGGTINLQKSAIVSNTANSDNSGGGEGGAIYNGGGSLTLNFNRIALNAANGSAASNAMRHASGTISNIQNNWWGTNSPATVINGTAAFTPYLQLLHTPASSPICANTSTGLTASFVLNSANANVLANLDRLIGLPITFGNAQPAGSSISAAQTTIQANGQATATFNAGATPGVGGADATVDNFASQAAITVQATTLGNLVYEDVNQDGDYDAGTDAVLNGVSVNLYTDNNGNNMLNAGDVLVANTTTAGGGLYSFSALCAGSYIVEVAASNFLPMGALYNAGNPYMTSPAAAAGDPDTDTDDNDDNGDNVAGFGVASLAITLGGGVTNTTLDFGFTIIPLPLELLSFAGQATGRSNLLTWETATEKNVSAHIVERSAEGAHWMEVGRRTGLLDSHVPVRYQLEDQQPLALTYYRLRSVDVDGAQLISKVIVVDRTGERFGIRSVSPNPATEQITVQFSALAEESVRLELVDAIGRLVLQQTVPARLGLNTALLPVSHLSAGVYTVLLYNHRVVAAPLRVVKK